VDPKDIILYGIAGVVAIRLVWQHGIKVAIGKWQTSQQEKTDATKLLATEIAELRKQMEGFALFPGLVKVCEAQVAEVAKLREAVGVFTKVVVREPAADEDVVENYDETQADRAYARGRYMAEGFSPDDAALRVDADEAIKNQWGTPGD
jgi:hypothetical protein